MSASVSSMTTETDIARHVRLLLETLNVQYPLRRVEMELSPSTFCQQLIEESQFFDHQRPKAPRTMPRTTFDSILEAAKRCANGDTSLSMVMFDGLYLRQFQLDPSYPSSLFFDNKVVVPHDAVFLVLYNLHVYASLRQSDSLQNLVSATCAFVPIKIVKRFVSVVTQAASSTLPVAPQPVTSAPAIRMSTFGLNVTAPISSVRQIASTRPLAGTRGQDNQGISRRASTAWQTLVSILTSIA
ncbi:hypothetical protein BDZ89DRAFT_353121 [Hymenopellis radicata]|nr:hypothetical protein BDZ89DRAFT_353121 [Hymenopellis radicata]